MDLRGGNLGSRGARGEGHSLGKAPAGRGRRPVAGEPSQDVLDSQEGSTDELRPVVALFADVVGSTALGERLNPDEIKIVLGEFSQRASKVVESGDGYVAAHMGDGIAAFFGLPRVREDDPERAAEVALSLLGEMEAYRDELHRAWSIDGFSIRIGVNRGWVASGLVGSAKPQLTALGDAVNVAARLQAEAAPGEVLIGETLAGLLQNSFVLEPCPTVALKGRKRPVAPWRLVRRKSTRFAEEAVAVLGRDTHKTAIREAHRDLVGGRGRVLFVVGEAGIGKSTLVSGLRCELMSEGALWIESKCGNSHADAPYHPFGGLLRHWLGLEQGSPDIAAKVRVGRILANLHELKPMQRLVLTRLAGAEGSGHAAVQMADLSSWEIHDETVRAIAGWLLAVAAEHPLVLVLEEFDRADPASVRLAEDLVALTEEAPILLVVVLRPGNDDAAWNLYAKVLANYSHRAQALHLEPLPPETIKEIVQGRQEVGPMVEGEVEEIARLADGNPLFAIELARSTKERGAVPSLDVGGRWRPPDRLAAILLGRIDSLRAEEKLLIKMAALYRGPIPRAVLEGCAPRPHFAESVRTLIQKGLLREKHGRDGTEYRFKHQLMKEAVCSLIPPAVQRALHGRIARVLDELDGGKLFDQDEFLSHAAESGDPRLTIRALVDAATRCREFGDNEGALGHIGAAIECAEVAGGSLVDVRSLRKQHVALLASAGAYEQAASIVLDEDVEGVARSDRGIRAARLLIDGGCFGAAEELLNTVPVLEGVGRKQEGLLAEAYLRLRKNEPERCRTLLDMLFRTGEPLGSPFACEVAALWAGYLAEVGEFAGAARWQSLASDVAVRIDDENLMLRMERNQGILDCLAGRLGEGKERLEGVYERAVRMGDVVAQLETVGNLLAVMCTSGELERGETLAKNASSWVVAPFWRVVVLNNAASIFIERDLMKLSEEVLAEMEELVVKHDLNRRHRVEGQAYLARIRVMQGELDQAACLVESALVGIGRMTSRADVRVLCESVRVEVCAKAGLVREAERSASAAVKWSQRAEVGDRVAPLRLLGVVRHEKSPGSGRDLVLKALDLSREIGMRLEEGRALRALASFGGPQADGHFEAARRIFTECGAVRELREMEAGAPV